MRKFYLLTLLAFLPLLANADAVEIDGIYYNLNAENHTAEVTTNPNGYSGDVVIPAAVMSQAANYSVTSIGYLAFRDCFSLTSITIPKNVTSIDYYAFLGCSALTSIQVESDNSVYDSRDNCNAIIETSTNTLIRGCKNTIIPTSVTTIGVEAFNCASGLLSLTIPSSVTSIGHDAFEACSDLVHVYCNAENVPTTDADAFENVDIGRYVTLHVPAGSVEAYQAAAPWNGFNKVVALSTNIPDVEILGIYYNLNEETLTAEVTKNPNGPYSGDLIVGGGIWYDSRLYSVTSIGKDAFALNGGITSVSIQEGVTTIGEGAFGYCPYLTSVTFPSSLISIGGAAFYGCERLTSVTIPANVTSISDNSFRSCKSLASIQVEDGNTKYDSRNNCNAIIEKENNTLISGCKNTVIPDNVTSIGAFAFEGISSLTSVTIPNSITSIGAWAFGYCNSLTSLTIPASVTTIDNDAFTNCSSLASIQVEEGNTVFDSRDNSKAIIETATNTLIRASNTTVIPSTVTTIGYRAFGGSGITSVTIPSSITSIEFMAFTDCKDLESISVESGNTKYDSRNNCNAVIETETNTLIAGCKNTIIPNTVTTIGQYAFGALGLTSITIPSSVTSIDHVAFWGNIELTDVYCNAESVPNTETDAFSSVLINQVTLHVPASSVDAYKAVAPWSGFKEVVPIETKKTINVATAGTLSQLISNDDKFTITDLKITGQLNGTDFRLLREMAGSDYQGHPTNGKLQKLDLSGANIVAGGENYFDSNGLYNENGDVQLTFGSHSVTTKDNVIGECLFAGCSQLVEIKIPTNTIEVGEFAFLNTNISSFDIVGSVEKIALSFFWRSKVSTLSIPQNVTTLTASDCFMGNQSTLTSISVDENNSKYDSRNNCNAIIEKESNTLILGCKNSTVPDGVTSIGKCAFYGCNGLTSITLPTSVTSLQEYAFFDTRLTSISLPSSLKRIEYDAFAYTEISSITIPASVEYIGQSIMRACSNLTQITVDAGNTKYDSRDNCNAIIETSTNTLIQGCNTSTIPASVIATGSQAFKECHNLESITIPSGVTSIEGYAFADCDNMESIIIPSSVTSIGSYAFWLCRSLADVYCYAETVPTTASDAFDNSNIANATLHVPVGCKAAYASATGWKDFGTILEGNEGTTFTAKTAEGWDMVFTILDESAKTCQVGYLDATWNQRAVDYEKVEGSLTIPETVNGYTVVRIGKNSLNNIDGMTSVTIPNTVTSIEDDAFFNCDGLISFELPASVTSIGTDALSALWRDISVKVAEGNTKYDSRDNCNAIIETATNKLLFGFKTTIIPATVTEIGERAFNNILGDYIGDYTLTIPSTITRIGDDAFGISNNLILQVEHTTPLEISENVFGGLSNSILRVPAGCKAAYASATGWKNFGTILEGNEGTTFTAKTTEGWDMVFTILDESEKTCQVGYLDGAGDKTAIDKHAVIGSVTIPQTIEGYTVVKIGKKALYNAYQMTSVTIPNTVTAIDEFAFAYCHELTSFELPASVTTIGDGALIGQESVTSIKVAEGNQNYDSRDNCNAIIETGSNTLIAGCKTTIIPNTVTSIRKFAFNRMSLTSIIIPGSVTSINQEAFGMNSELTDVYCLAANVPTTYDTAFRNTPIGNATLHVLAGSIEDYQAASPWSGFKEIVAIPDLEYTDAQGVIYTLNTDCQTYTASGFNKESPGAIIIPATVNGLSVTSIGGGFRSSGLTLVYIPASVTSVVFPALRWCPELESIQVENGNTVFDSRNNCNAIIETASNTLINGCKNTVIPNDVTTIGEWAFGYSGITSVTIPANVTQIQSNAFSGCGSVESIQVESGNNVYDSRDNCNAIIETASNVLIRGCHNTVIPNSVTSIYVAAFRGCGSLTSINIPENVTSIGSDAFWECGNLTTVTLSKNVTSIGSLAFADCALTDVCCLAANVPTTEATTFQDTPIGSATLHVPAGSVEAYQAAAPWSGFNKVVALSTNIPDVEIQGVYYNLNEETLTAEVTMNPNKYSGEVSIASGIWYDSRLYSVTSIGVDAFQFCNLLTSVVIPNSVTSIGSYAFYFCEDLSSIMIPNSVTKIFGNPFQGCSSLESILVEEGNTTYDSRNNCNAIIETGSNTLISGCKNTVIPANVTTIGDNAFTEIANLTSITIPASVEYIGSASFSSCSNLESIQVESGNTKYDSRNNCNAIIETASNTLIHGCKNTVIPANVTSIGEMAFDECDGLTSVTIPSAVTFIGISAFEECKDLVSMQVESGNTVYDSRNNCNAIIETASNTLISGCKNTIIPISVTSIGENAFRYCFGLESVTIPCDVTSIGNMAFFNCYQLTDIYCSAENVPTTGYGAFDAINGNNVTLHVPAGSVEAYKAASPWKDFGTICSSVTSLFDGTNLWTSYVAQEDDAIPAGLEAYVISSLSETSAVASQIDYIPQGVPILLKRNDATTNSFDFTIGTGTAPTTNLLKVYDTDKTVSNREGYILFKDEFVLVDEGTLPAGRVFLPLNGGNSANTRGIVIEGEGTTGIQNLVSDSEVSHGVWYDLQGRKIDGKPIKKGVYILNGRKVVVK